MRGRAFAPPGQPRAAPAQPATFMAGYVHQSDAVSAQLVPKRVTFIVRRGWISARITRAKTHHRAHLAIGFSHSHHPLSHSRNRRRTGGQFSPDTQ